MWQDRQQARLTARTRRRTVGAGARHKLVFVDRLLATLVGPRHGVTHDVLAAWFGVDRSTITRAVNEIRPLLAERGCRIDTGLRLRTLADVGAHLDHMRATEIRVRRPTAKRAGRQQFVSGKSRTNAVKALVITDAKGRLLFCGATVRGSTADITQARQTGLTDWPTHTGGVQILADAGYQGLGAQTREQVITPTLRHHKKALEHMPGIAELRQAHRREHAHRRVHVEHCNARLNNRRSLARHLGRRDSIDPTQRAIAGLLPDHQHTDRSTPVAAITASPAR